MGKESSEASHPPVRISHNLPVELKTETVWYLIERGILRHPRYANPRIKWSRKCVPPFGAVDQFKDQCYRVLNRMRPLAPKEIPDRRELLGELLALISHPNASADAGRLMWACREALEGLDLQPYRQWPTRLTALPHEATMKAGRVVRVPSKGGTLEIPAPFAVPNWRRYEKFWQTLRKAAGSHVPLSEARLSILLQLWKCDQDFSERTWNDRTSLAVAQLRFGTRSLYSLLQRSISSQLRYHGPGTWLIRTIEDDLVAWCVTIDLLFDLTKVHEKRRAGRLKADMLRGVVRLFRDALGTDSEIPGVIERGRFTKKYCGLKPIGVAVPKTWLGRVTRETVIATFVDALLDKPGPDTVGGLEVPNPGKVNIGSYRASPKLTRFLLKSL